MRRLVPVIVLGCVVAQTMVNLQQMKLNERLIAGAEGQGAAVLVLTERVRALEKAPPPAPAPHVEVGRGLFAPPEVKNAWAPAPARRGFGPWPEDAPKE